MSVNFGEFFMMKSLILGALAALALPAAAHAVADCCTGMACGYDDADCCDRPAGARGQAGHTSAAPQAR